MTEIADGLATTTYAYDNNGNVITAGEWEYGCDYRNRLISAGQGTATSSYAYDHTDQRIRNVTSSATTTYVNRLYSTAPAQATQRPPSTFSRQADSSWLR